MLTPSELSHAVQNGQQVILQVPAGEVYHFIIVDDIQEANGIAYYMTRDPFAGPRGVQSSILNNAISGGANAVVIRR